jgi:hypothetical protein
MRLQDQVCSLSLAKRLKDLGVTQHESVFYWRPDGTALVDYWEVHDGMVAAFTVGELGEILPDLYYSERWAGTKEWTCNVRHDARLHKRRYPNMKADTEADVRAKMLIYLIENSLLGV